MLDWRSADRAWLFEFAVGRKVFAKRGDVGWFRESNIELLEFPSPLVESLFGGSVETFDFFGL